MNANEFGCDDGGERYGAHFVAATPLLFLESSGMADRIKALPGLNNRFISIEFNERVGAERKRVGEEDHRLRFSMLEI